MIDVSAFVFQDERQSPPACVGGDVVIIMLVCGKLPQGDSLTWKYRKIITAGNIG